MKVNQGIDLGDHIVLGDDTLLRKVKYRLPQVHAFPHLVLGDLTAVLGFERHAPCDVTGAIDDGNDDVDSCSERGAVFTEPFDDQRFTLAYNAHAFDDDDGGQQKDESG